MSQGKTESRMREADAQQEIEREGEEEHEAASRSFPPHEFARRAWQTVPASLCATSQRSRAERAGLP